MISLVSCMNGMVLNLGEPAFDVKAAEIRSGMQSLSIENVPHARATAFAPTRVKGERGKLSAEL